MKKYILILLCSLSSLACGMNSDVASVEKTKFLDLLDQRIQNADWSRDTHNYSQYSIDILTNRWGTLKNIFADCHDILKTEPYRRKDIHKAINTSVNNVKSGCASRKDGITLVSTHEELITTFRRRSTYKYYGLVGGFGIAAALYYGWNKNIMAATILGLHGIWWGGNAIRIRNWKIPEQVADQIRVNNGVKECLQDMENVAKEYLV